MLKFLPVWSPDLNPIEHCWFPIKNAIIEPNEWDQIQLLFTHRLLKTPEIITATRKNLQTDMTKETIFTHTNQIETIWELLFPEEQRQICQQLIKTVWMQDDGLTIDLQSEGLGNLLTHSGAQAC